MEMMENSAVGGLLLRLWYVLYGWYEESGLARFLRGVSRVWTRWFHASAVMSLLVREGVLPRAWRDSLICRAMETLLNLPAALLHWIYRKFRPVFDNSVCALLAFGAGEQTPAAIGWLMLAFMVVPYDNWDNRYSLMGFVLMALLFLAGGMRSRALRLDLKSVGPYAVIFAGAVCLAWPVSYSSALSLRFLFFHLTGMLCVAVTVSSVERPGQLKRLAGFASLAMFCTGAYGIVQRIQGVEVNYSYVDPLLNEGMPGRVFSVFENPNAFAEVLVMLIPLAAALVLCSKSVWGRLGALCAAGVGIMALGMTYSRASWIGAVVSAAVFVFLWNRKLIPGLILLGLLALPMLPDTIFNRILTIFNLKDSSTSSRFPLYQAALEMIRERPVQGAGLGTDAVRLAIKDLNLYHGTAPFVHAHNLYLQIWLETGLIGIVSYLAAMISGVKAASKAARLHCSHEVRLITIGAAAAVAGILVDCLADYLWNYPRVMVIFWFVFSVMLSGVKLARRAAAQKGEPGGPRL